MMMTCVGVTDASVLTWQGKNATSSNWRSGTNWVEGVYPGQLASSGDSVIFTGSTRMTNNNNSSSVQLASLSNITFDSGAGGSFLITGTGLQLSGGITNNSSYLQRITMPLELTGDRNVNAAAGDILLGGMISGAGGLAKSGAYTLTLTNQNTYTGATVVQAGTLSISKAFLNDNTNVWLTSGATLNLNFSGTDTINYLYIDNVLKSAGTWGSVGSGADHESTLITGTGLLSVIPEPATIGMLGLGALVVLLARRQLVC
jgi:autotransporter-associated beta strand protein